MRTRVRAFDQTHHQTEIQSDKIESQSKCRAATPTVSRCQRNRSRSLSLPLAHSHQHARISSPTCFFLCAWFIAHNFINYIFNKTHSTFSSPFQRTLRIFTSNFPWKTIFTCPSLAVSLCRPDWYWCRLAHSYNAQSRAMSPRRTLTSDNGNVADGWPGFTRTNHTTLETLDARGEKWDFTNR